MRAEDCKRHPKEISRTKKRETGKKKKKKETPQLHDHNRTNSLLSEDLREGRGKGREDDAARDWQVTDILVTKESSLGHEGKKAWRRLERIFRFPGGLPNSILFNNAESEKIVWKKFAPAGMIDYRSQKSSSLHLEHPVGQVPRVTA